MKKILTLLIAAGAFVTLHAQSREETRGVILGSPNENGRYGSRDRDVILGGGNNSQYPNTYPNNGNYGYDRQYQVDQINREYNVKIESIRNNRYLSYQERDRMIRQLERERQIRIAEINRQYSNARYNDRNDKHDNGKHKGWNKKNKNKNWKHGRDDWD